VKELLVASGNKGKLVEIAKILDGCVERIYSLADFPDIPAVREDGDTFEENARKKAMNAALATGMPVLADDSGLVVDALDGRPGVYSARFAGEGSNDAENNDRLLKELAGVAAEKRTAAFHCVAVLCFPDGSSRVFRGELQGVILERPRGAGGFGYDPLFLVPDQGKTLAELHMDIKNGISHRGKALGDLRSYLSCG
jgi:XTP/dITP diphosphohydrolase